MSPLTPDRGPSKGRAEPWRAEPYPHDSEDARLTDEDIDSLWAKVTSEPPPSSAPDTLPDIEQQDVVGVDDIKDHESPAAPSVRTGSASERPDARKTLLPRPRTATLLGMPAPQTEPSGGRSPSFPPAPLPDLRTRPAFPSSTRRPSSPTTTRPATAPAPRNTTSTQGLAFPSRPAPRDTIPMVPNFTSAMKARVNVAGHDLPLWMAVASLALPLVLGSVLLGVATTRRDAPPSSAAAIAPSSTPAAIMAPPAAAPPPSEPAVTCAKPTAPAPVAGSSSAPSVSDVLDRAIARVQDETAVARQFVGVLERVPEVIEQKAVLAELRQHLSRPHAAPEALRALASMQGSAGADLLYEIWIGTKERTTATELARELLYSREVRSKASPALDVVLDLRTAQGCEQQRGLLPSATKHGDQRALPLLGKLLREQGCGPSKRQDCYACLRSGDELNKAIKSVNRRIAPKRLSAR
ncbi:MAG TPA: hypothetical protein VM686_05610 [Polyangiaceae bacterium]|nr:hypothetical protein [Polyangiaceae bacterium]